MIIDRYLFKETFKTAFAVTFVLLLVFLSNQLVRYLNQAAAGNLAGSVLFKILLYQIPGLLGLLLPLALFLGIMLSYGRLYADSEMTVLIACGVSQRRILRATIGMMLLIFFMVFILNLWLTPLTTKKRHILLQQSGYSALLATILPGRFQQTNGGKSIFYVKRLVHGRKEMQDIFVAQQEQVNPRGSKKPIYRWSILSAKGGYQKTDLKTGLTYVVAKNGNRYKGVPGRLDYALAHFATYAVQVGHANPANLSNDIKSLPTWVLWGLRHRVRPLAELEWRLSMPLSVILLVLLAVPLSKVSSRKGRYNKMLIAILIYIFYANMLFVSRSWLENHLIPAWLGMWWVHVTLLCLVIGLWFCQDMRRVRWLKSIFYFRSMVST